MANRPEVRRARGKILQRMREERGMSQRGMAMAMMRHLGTINPEKYGSLQLYERDSLHTRLQDTIVAWEQGRYDVAWSKKPDYQEAVAKCLGKRSWVDLFMTMMSEIESAS